jgi:hypothetical protein
VSVTSRRSLENRPKSSTLSLAKHAVFSHARYAVLDVFFMQKCYVADFLNTWSCSPSRLTMFTQKLRLNLDLAEMYQKRCVAAADPTYCSSSVDNLHVVWQYVFCCYRAARPVVSSIIYLIFRNCTAA